MKVTIKKEEHDIKTTFATLKAGETFSFADPHACKSEVFMKLSPTRDQSGIEVVNLDSGKVGPYANFKKEIISVDQDFVYRLDAQLVVSVW